MATASRLTSTARLKDRYGNRSSVIGVGRSVQAVDFIAGTYRPVSGSAPVYPAWADGRKVVQVMISRNLSQSDATEVTEQLQFAMDNAPGTISGSNPSGWKLFEMNLSPDADTLVVKSIDTVFNSSAAVDIGDATYPMVIDSRYYNDGTVQGARGINLRPDAVDFAWHTDNDSYKSFYSWPAAADAFYGSSQHHNRHVDLLPDMLGYRFCQLSDFYNTLRAAAKQDLTVDDAEIFQRLLDARVTSTRKYLRAVLRPGTDVTITVNCGPAPLLDDEINEVAATISADDTSLNGSFPMRGGDVLTMGFTASEMPAITEGAALFGVTISQELNPEFGYCFVVK